VNTGEAVVSLGARPAFGESMVAGDVVNTASRLQSAAPVNGVVVGELTYQATKDAIEYEPAPPVIAKGKERPVKAWSALRPLVAPGIRPVTDIRMIGRALEVTILEALWERALAERLPHVISIFGPAGVGKTTLATEFDRIVADAGVRVVHGRSMPYRESGTYGALATQVMRLSGVFESDPAPVVVEKLRGRVAELLAGTESDPAAVAGHLGVIVGVDAGAEATDRDALFSSARDFLEAVAREQPTILIFEDVHWADANLLDLVLSLATLLRELPMLFVTLSRPELLDVRGDWGAGLPGFTALTLGPLNEQFARQLAARRIADDAQANEVIRLAEGNPLFIEQLAASIGELQPGRLPTTIREIVAARLDALPRPERALLLDAAVIGKNFWLNALRAMGHDADLHLIEELERRDLIRRERSSIFEGQQQFAFTHALIRDVAYELLPRADRARRHALIAEYFETATGSSAQAIGAQAHHWRDAGDNDRAVAQLVRAAELAERGWAKDHAATLYREALQLVPAEDAERRSALRRRLAMASAASFHIADVTRGESPPA
jgi:hypothetical protein